MREPNNNAVVTVSFGGEISGKSTMETKTIVISMTIFRPILSTIVAAKVIPGISGILNKYISFSIPCILLKKN